VARFDRPEPVAVFSLFARRAFGMSKSSPQQPPQNFERSLAELEKIVGAMEAGQLPLDESIAAYKRGAELLQFCQNALKDASQQVKVLEAGVLKDFSIDGEPTVADRTD
jgi:exodeoxyribonuclease VII small subunit